MRLQNFASVAQLSQGLEGLTVGKGAQMEASDMYMDIPDCALLNRPLTESVGEDGIWDDFCGSFDSMDFKNEFNVRYISTLLAENQSITFKSDCIQLLKYQEMHIHAFEKAHPVKNRTVLSAQDARDIFKRRFTGLYEHPGASVFIAQKYCVSPKTVRDIWNR